MYIGSSKKISDSQIGCFVVFMSLHWLYWWLQSHQSQHSFYSGLNITFL